MTKRYDPPARGGVAGMALLFSVAVGAVGLLVDFMTDPAGSRWLLTQPGARAALGVAVALALLACVHVVTALLGRRADDGGGDA